MVYPVLFSLVIIYSIMYKTGITILMVLACACGRNPESDLHQHEESLQQEETHQHENTSSQSTLFTDNTETTYNRWSNGDTTSNL